MKVESGQNTFDICLQEFGDMELLFEEVLIPNGLTLNSNLNADQELNINSSGKGDQELKDYVLINDLTINNRSIQGTQITENQIAIQWPVYVDLEEAIYLTKRIQVV